MILGIETSCDETSFGLVNQDGKLIDQVISSQIDVHRQYGGVVPELASRHHLEIFHPLLSDFFESNKITLSDLTALAVTYGPGLIGSLLVGVSGAKGLALGLDIPLVGVNHLEAHLLSPRLEHDLHFPYLALLVSGGHSFFVWVKALNDYRILGRTRDDAVGESFDKVAKMLALGYPGGPVIERLAKEAQAKTIRFPRPMLKQGLDFSFSGLKTAVRQYLSTLTESERSSQAQEVAWAFQDAVIDTCGYKFAKALEYTQATQATVVGGVACNKTLLKHLRSIAKEYQCEVVAPSPSICTDNGAMIARVGWELLESGNYQQGNLTAQARLPLQFKEEGKL